MSWSVALSTGNDIRIFWAISARVGCTLTTLPPAVYVPDSTNAKTYSNAVHVYVTGKVG